MLIYIDHLQNWLAFWTLSIDFPNLAAIDLVQRVTFGVSRHFLDNTWAEWPEMWHTDVSWSITEVDKSGHALWIFQILKKSNFVSTGMIAIVARLNLVYVFLFKGRRQCQGEWRHNSDALRRVLSSLFLFTVKPVYNDHLMGYFSAFWSSSRWPRAT